MSLRPLTLAVAALLIGARGAQAADPLLENLRRLESRASTRPAPPKRSAAKKPAPKRPAARRSARPAAVKRPAARPDTGTPVAYSKKRFGAKPSAGDLDVRITGPETVHVYFVQRLVSNGGNGQARLPDIAPGKRTVMAWSPTSGKRKTWWVTVKPGMTASLQARLN
jgi:hypothetical protein